MADNNLRLNYSSPLKRCDSDGKEHLQKDPMVCNSEEKYGHQRGTNNAAEQVSETFICREQSAQSSRDPLTVNETKPVYSRKFRLLDQVKRKTKPPHAFSLPPAKHFKESKGNYKSTIEKMPSSKDKKGVETFIHKTKVHHSSCKNNSANEGDCSVNEGHDQSVKVTQSVFCNNNPESTKHSYFEADRSAPKCPQKLNRQIQIEPRMRVRKPVHSVTVMPLSFTSSIAQVESNDKESNHMKTLGSYTVSASETLKPSVLTTESIRKASDAVPGKERDTNLSKDTMPVEHHKPEKQKETPLLSEQENQLKTFDYLVPLQISQHKCVSPSPFFCESQSETETTKRFYEDNICTNTEGTERRTFYPIISISKATPPPSPEPGNQEALQKYSKPRESSRKYDSNKPQQMTIQGLANHHIVDGAQRSPRKSPQPYLNLPDEESTMMHRRSPVCSPTRNRSKSPLYMEDFKIRSKSPQNNWHPYVTHSTQTQSPTSSNTNITVSSGRRSPFPYQPRGSPRPSGQSYGIDVLSNLSTPLLVITPPEFLCRENAHSPRPYQNLQSLSSESSGIEEKLSLCSPVSCFAKRSNVSEAKNINNLTNARNPSQRMKAQTERNWLLSTKENGTVKRKLSLNKDQEPIEQCLTRSPKFMRKDNVSPKSGNDAKRSHLTSKKLEVTNVNSITKKVDTCASNREIKSINSSYKTVAAKDISTQTIPVSVGNKKDRKTELGINCKKSKDDQKESWFPGTARCHLTHLDEQELACSGNLISKTYNGGNPNHLKQMTLNRQTDQQENLLNALHTLPVPFIYEWPRQIGNTLELPRNQVSMNTKSQCRQHLLDSDVPVSNQQERRSCSPCLRPTMNGHYATYNQRNLDKYNLEPGVYKAKDEYCFPKLPQICVAHQQENKEDDIPKGRCHKLPSANYSNCNYHNVTSAGIIMHERGSLDSSNKIKKDNTGSKPLRFHLMTNFPVRDTTAQKTSSMSNTVKKDIENEKRSLTKTSQSRIKKTVDLAPVTGKTNGKVSGKKVNNVRSSLNIQESESPQEKRNETNDVKNSSELDFNCITVPSTRRCVTPLGGLLTNYLQDSITPKEAKITSSSSMCDLKPVRSTFGENIKLGQENNKNNFHSVKQSGAKRRWKKLVRLCGLNSKCLNERPSATNVTDNNFSKWSNCCKEITAGGAMTKNEKPICEKQKKVKDDANVTRTEPRTTGQSLSNNNEREAYLTAKNANRNFDTFKTGSQTSSVQGITHYANADPHKALNIFFPKLLSISAKNVLQSKDVENQQENITPVTATEELSRQFQNSASPKKAVASDVLSRRRLNTSSSKDLPNQSSDGSLTKKTTNAVNITSMLNTLAGKMSDSANTPQRSKRDFAEKSQMVTETSNASERAAECGTLPFSENIENDESANLAKQHSLSNKPLTPIMDLLQLSLNSKTSLPLDKVSVPSTIYESFEEKNTKPETKSNSNYNHTLEQSMRETRSLKLHTQSKYINLKQAQNAVAFYAQMASDNSQGTSVKNVKTTINEISKIPTQNVDDIALKVNMLSKLPTNRLSPRPTEKGESHLNSFNERTPSTSPKTKISNDRSTFQRNSIHNTYDKVLSCSEMETSFSHDQRISNNNQPIRSVSTHFATVSSTSRTPSDKNLLPANLNDRVTIETEQVQPVNTRQQTRQSTPRYLSIADSKGSQFISYGKTTGVKPKSSASFEGESSMTRARSSWTMFSTTDGTSLSQSHLTYNDQLNSMNDLANSKTAPITPYSTASHIMMNPTSFPSGLSAICPEKFITEHAKETRAGSLTNVTWALLKDNQQREAHADSSTESSIAARANSVPDDDTKNRINSNNHSDICTNLTWLLTACPPNKLISREIQTCRPNQLDLLTTLHNKKPQWNQQVQERHEEHHITCQAGQNKTENLPFSSVKYLRKSPPKAEVTGKLAHKKTTHIAEHHQKKFIENPVQSQTCLQELKAKMNNTTANDGQNGLHSHIQVSHESIASGKLKTSVLSHLKIPSANGTLETVKNASQTMQSTNNQSQLTLSHKPEVLMPSPFSLHHHLSTRKRNEKEENEIREQDGRIPNEGEQNISSIPIKSINGVPAKMHEILDEFARTEDCLPIITAAFSLRERPDIQEQIKRFGNQRQVEVDSSKVKGIEKSSWVKSDLE